MSKATFISHFCSIENDSMIVDGTEIFRQRDSGFVDFAKALYKEFDLSYPKFHKMDGLSKLMFLSAEALSQKTDFQENMAIVIANRSSSIEIDRKHQETIADPNNFYPSPANFVYTLPNIGIGEISIRHKIQGENAFFVSEKFDAQLLHSYCESLIQTGKCKQVLCGWADFDHLNAKSFLYLLSRSGPLEHTVENLDYLHACNTWKN